ncbi:GrvA [Salmonella phage 19]|nr:GrvA [Salmonella phage 19]
MAATGLLQRFHSDLLHQGTALKVNEVPLQSEFWEDGIPL